MRLTIETLEELKAFMKENPEYNLYLGTRPLTRELTIYRGDDYCNHTLYLFNTDKEVVGMNELHHGVKCAAEVKIREG